MEVHNLLIILAPCERVPEFLVGEFEDNGWYPLID